MKKKSLVGWTRKNWQQEFYKHDITGRILSPEIYSSVLKTVKEVLDELEKVLMNTYKADGCVTSAITEIHKIQARTQLDALYKEKYLGILPEELVADDTGVNGHCSNYVNGFNSAIQEMKRRVG